MMNWVKVDISIPKQDFITQVKVNGKKICLVKHQGEIHAIENNCPHAGGILSGGWCREGNIVCPIHRYEYNLTNGRGAVGQGDYIDIYPILEKEDGFYVGFKVPLWKRIFGGKG